jgi:hypothetical protein
MSDSGFSERTKDPRAALLTEFGKLKRQHELRLQNPNPRYPPVKKILPGRYVAGVWALPSLLPPDPQYDPLTYNSHLLTLLRMLRDDWQITIEQATTTKAGTTTTFTHDPASAYTGAIAPEVMPTTPPIVSSPYPSLYDAVAGAVQYAVWYAKGTDV